MGTAAAAREMAGLGWAGLAMLVLMVTEADAEARPQGRPVGTRVAARMEAAATE